MKRGALGILFILFNIAIANAQPPTGGAGTQTPPAMVNLTVSRSGAGSGTVTGAGPINCGITCTASYVSGVTTRLTATSVSGSTFTGWSGACSGTGVCIITMSSNKNVTATFTASVAFTRYLANNGNTSGNCTSATSGTNGPCRIDYGLGTYAAPGEKFGMIDGVYRGDSNMLTLYPYAPDISGTSTNPIVVQAVNDGGVFIDGQFVRQPLYLYGNNWWIIKGIDFGNSGPELYVGHIRQSSNNVFQRICISNAHYDIPWVSHNRWNVHVFVIEAGQNNLMEDFCAFGTGRNTISMFASSGVPVTGNIWRRIWVRYEGWAPGDTYQGCVDGAGKPNGSGGQASQLDYFQYGTGGNNILENQIVIYDPEQMVAAGMPPYGCGEIMAGTVFRSSSTEGPTKLYGYIGYGYNGFNTASATAVDFPWWYDNDNSTDGSYTRQLHDIFIDTRSQTTTTSRHAAFEIYCNLGSLCSGNSADRLTAVKLSGHSASSFTGVSPTNFHECSAAGSPTSSLGGCPDFYTGVGSGTLGARNCYEYIDGVLDTSRPLWPWRMDDRIKAALARANAAGTGGSALAGTSGTSYASSTVTSEIVSRYGTVPPQCMRSTELFVQRPMEILIGALFILLAGAAIALRRKNDTSIRFRN